MTKAITKMEDAAAAIEKRFELEQRMAKAYITSSILPAHYKNIGDILILNEMSRNLGIPMVMLAQQLYVVHGRPQLSGQGAIALINMSGKFDKQLMFEERQNPWGVRAYTYIDGEKVEGPWIDDALIQSEGWANKNPKWRTMKDQMARYRAAAWFARLYAPEALMGMSVEGEVEDTEAETAPSQAQADDLNAQIFTQPAPAIEEKKEEPKEEKPKKTRKRATKKKREVEVPQDVVDAQIEEAVAPNLDEAAAIPEPQMAQPTQTVDAGVDMVTGEVNPHPTQAHTTATAETPTSRRKGAQDNAIPYTIAVHAGEFINAGLKRQDIKAFIEKSGITEDNVDLVVQDKGGLVSLVEMFYNEEQNF